jgi:calcium-dependent protein kinase
VHRDLKLENVLLKGKELKDGFKIIDFGTSRVYKKGYKMTMKKGTPNYVAPEVLNQRYNYKCDLWSCGVIAFILLSGR